MSSIHVMVQYDYATTPTNESLDLSSLFFLPFWPITVTIE